MHFKSITLMRSTCDTVARLILARALALLPLPTGCLA